VLAGYSLFTRPAGDEPSVVSRLPNFQSFWARIPVSEVQQELQGKEVLEAGEER
jgi:hypothetical protein